MTTGNSSEGTRWRGTSISPQGFRPRIPGAPRGIEAGKSLSDLLGSEAVDCLARNLKGVYPDFASAAFRQAAHERLAPLGLMDRGRHLANVLHEFLPATFSAAVGILLRSLTPPQAPGETCSLAGFFYLPHTCFVAQYGLDASNNRGRDPFAVAMNAQRELTQRFTAEFSIRPFLVHRRKETLSQLIQWTLDESPDVRRLCSEGTRPRLPWGMRLREFVGDPSHSFPILEALKDDSELYVRRSVANHLGDIGKDHPDLLFEICRSWLGGASPERLWLIRHALRYPAKKGHKFAIELRQRAGGRRDSKEWRRPPSRDGGYDISKTL